MDKALYVGIGGFIGSVLRYWVSGVVQQIANNPAFPLGTLAGAWMNKRVPEKPFAAILYVAAAVTAGHMIWASLR